MKPLQGTPANAAWCRRVEDAVQAVLSEVLKRGFHGKASLEILVADGTIYRLTRSVEHVEK